MVQSTSLAFVIITLVIVIGGSLFGLFSQYKRYHKRTQRQVFDTYNPDIFTFSKRRTTIIFLIYKQPHVVDVVPFDSFLAATQWALMIVRNSREIWGFPNHLSDLELLINWTSYTDGKEFLVITEQPLKTIKRK